MEAKTSDFSKSLVTTTTLSIRPKESPYTSISPPEHDLLVKSFVESDGEPPTDLYGPPTSSNTTEVIRGGFGPLPPRDYRLAPAFPPPPNAAYYLDSLGRAPKGDKQQWRGSKEVDESHLLKSQLSHMRKEHSEEDQLHHMDELHLGDHTIQSQESKGKALADTVNFSRPAWITRLPELPGGQTFYPPSQQKADFIKAIDSGEPLIYCTKCSEAHIPPGPTLTLEDRDTCGSMLPGWFPASRFRTPWGVFTNMLNQLAECVEDLRYLDSKEDPDKPPWDMEWHSFNPQWEELGRPAEGWWKCKSGMAAPVRERYCKLCHEKKTDARTSRLTREDILAKKAAIEKFMEMSSEEVGRRDRQYVEAQ